MSDMTGALGGIGAIKDDPKAKAARERWGELKTERAPYEQDWEDIARLMRPQRGRFSTDDHNSRPHDKALSSAPIIAQSNLAAGLYGTLINPANRWFGMKLSDPDKNKLHPVKLWLDVVTRRILASFGPQVSPFYSSGIQLLSDICAFGNSAQYHEMDMTSRRIHDVTLSLAEVVYDIDPFGQVNEVVRRFRLKPQAAARMFGSRNLPPKILELAEKGSQDLLWFYHHVLPNDGFVRGKLGPQGKRWLSVYASDVDCALLRIKGYDEMPFHAPRWEVESGAIYGTGPGFTALASARLVHQMDAATIRAAQHAADPTKLAPDRDAMPLNGTFRPGSVVYGGVNMQGNPLIRNMETHNGIGLTVQQREALIEEIRDAFHWSLMNLSGRTGMTATEVMTIQEERQRLYAPHVGRVQHEYLGPVVASRFSMLWRAGQLPPPPPEAEGAALEVDYLSAAAMAQKSMEGGAIMRVLEDVAPLSQLDPRYIERLDPDAVLEALHDARGAPADILRSREDTDAIAQQRQDEQAAAQQMQMLQQAGGAARDLAGAAAQAGLVQ